jgi:general secretion pathway protein A
MEYYNILNFKKEPFSNSPEPEFLFSSPQHTGCLQKLEMSVRLRRGLNVVIGDIGTGKTTLCRKLLQNFSFTPADSAEIETYLLLDPSFNSAIEFLQTVCSVLGIKDANQQESEWQLKEKIKNYLFAKGVDEDKIVVLVIDEGQKIPNDCLEILREFLNYETNNYKLLQIIIFAQKEFDFIIKKRANLFDRVNIFYYLGPLNFKQTRAMIKFRLAVARNFEIASPIFNFWGYAAIYLSTGGYPRKVVALCHEVILKLIIRNRNKAGWFLVRSCVSDMTTPLFRRIKWAAVGVLFGLALFFPVRAIISEYGNAPAYQQLPAAPNVVTSEKLQPVNLVNNESENVNTASISNSEITQQEKQPEYEMPDSLGMLTIRKGMTLWWTLYNIYGETGPKIIDKVVKANPHIKNRDKIEEGYIINLPSIPAEVKPVSEGKFVVLLKEGKDIEEIYRYFDENRYLKNIPRLIFFPFWDKKGTSITYSVVIDKNFNDAQEAQTAINKLPSPVAVKAKVLSQWDANTVFFNRKALRH